MPVGISIDQSTLPVSTSNARICRSRVPVKTRPPAVTTGPTFGKWLPVFLMPFAASSSTSPSGICHLIVPRFRSYAVSVLHGGAIAGSPLLVIMKPNALR